MRKAIGGLSGLAGLLVSQVSLAGSPLSPNSTFDLNWTSGATAVPTLGLYGTIALALLVMVVLFVSCATSLRLCVPWRPWPAWV